MGAIIEYIDERTHSFRVVNFAGFEQPETKERAEEILGRLKIKYIKVTKWTNDKQTLAR